MNSKHKPKEEPSERCFEHYSKRYIDRVNEFEREQEIEALKAQVKELQDEASQNDVERQAHVEKEQKEPEKTSKDEKAVQGSNIKKKKKKRDRNLEPVPKVYKKLADERSQLDEIESLKAQVKELQDKKIETLKKLKVAESELEVLNRAHQGLLLNFFFVRLS